MTRWQRALVTGASSGIGESIAKELAARGTELVLVARSKDRLVALANELPVECEVLVADLADDDDLAEVGERLADAGSPVDLLVNNAGFGVNGNVVTHGTDVEAGMVDVNIVALHRLSVEAANLMSDRGRGGILNISSVGAFAAAPGSATYAATKAFVLNFTDALHDEIRDAGVHVTCVCPGLTRTEFQDRGGYDLAKLPDAAWQTADEVAQQSLDAVDGNKRLLIPGAQNKAMVGAMKLMPGFVRRRVFDAMVD